MPSRGNTQLDGQVRESLPNTMFRVALSDGRLVLATPLGKLRRSFVRILPGDRVRLEFTKYDRDRGRIIQKYQK